MMAEDAGQGHPDASGPGTSDVKGKEGQSSQSEDTELCGLISPQRFKD